ncbi:Signal transduction histidine kinase [Paraoerskovia marina]|uniref:Signal transduction histidine-protein kinase/phosphatase MprB n=1 Tax=Paraoerskovia marina TaxID=545619 RepID=A0A1H1R3Z2_9CELL|nr:HAMP domain-containing sensor histidine kinase [Paraoerskovia marina]SDS29669.1 Signal transduction histidine kinase [Paraoerskovia marina]
MPANGTPGARRHTLPDVRPLDRFGSIKVKLGVVVAASVLLGVFITWIGLRNDLGPSRTLPLAIGVSLLLTGLLSRGMTSPLREMTTAAQAMAAGDYSREVHATSHDEVGQLAVAFNMMADDLASSDRVRRELIANVSHELRTPVAALQAQLENLVDGVTEPTPATLQGALDQTERLTRLVSYLLDLSRIEAGAAELNISPVLVGDFLEDSASSLSMTEAGKDLRYVVDVSPEDLVVDADRERLRQVVTNLVHNAIRHSPQDGEIRLEGYADQTAEGDVVVIEVIDQGPGIAEADRERIFDRFVSGTNQMPRPGRASGGTGIGLAIVRWAVDLHGGQVEVADSSDGATMRVTLPAHRPAAGLPAHPDGGDTREPQL